uniref:Serpentine receptor class gamma n=1 Tax=Rhabditophanes sp. KR3021 TaxID=114890 RepID=A0AC35TVK3_9BILA
MDSLSHQFIYKNEACVAIYTIVISMNWVCSFRGARSTFLHTVLGRPVCYQMVYSKLIFLAFTSIPNIAVLVACLVGLSEMLSNILIDVMILTVTISTISTLPFYVFKNKDIRNFFFQLSVVKTVYESYSMSKEPKTTVSMISDLK